MSLQTVSNIFLQHHLRKEGDLAEHLPFVHGAPQPAEAACLLLSGFEEVM